MNPKEYFSKGIRRIRKLGENPPGVAVKKLSNYIFTVTPLTLLLPDEKNMQEYEGGEILINTRESMMMRERALGVYEYRKKELFKEILEEGDSVLDLGANKGFFTLLSASIVGEEGKVVSAEPHPENLSDMRKSMEENGYENIEIFPGAVSDENGETELFIGEKSGWHSIKHDFSGDSITVDTRTLNSLMEEKEVDDPDLIKIDVEGAENDILREADLSECSPKLIIDVHEVDRAELYDILTEKGFVVFDYTSGEKIPIDREEFEESGLDEIYAER